MTPTLTDYPNGISSFGVPVLGPGGGSQVPLTTGKYFFVSSGIGSDSNRGDNPAEPFATIGGALAACTANNGDVIILMPGHTETITAAAGIALNVAGVSVVGLGSGHLRPTINFTTSTAATLTVTAANCSISNVYFDMTGVDALVSGIVISAAGFTFDGNEVLTADSGGQAVLALLTTAGADRMKVLNSFFHGSTDAGTTAAICIVGGDSIVISNNVFQGAYSSGVGAIQQITTTTTNCVVTSNVIQNFTASCTKAMVFTSSSTGQIANNRMQILSGTAPITGAAMSWVGGNYYAATIATAGTLI